MFSCDPSGSCVVDEMCLSEAFDKVHRKGLICKLQELGILEVFWNYVKATWMFSCKGHC